MTLTVNTRITQPKPLWWTWAESNRRPKHLTHTSHSNNLAGAAGIEPAHTGIKIPGLTILAMPHCICWTRILRRVHPQGVRIPRHPPPVHHIADGRALQLRRRAYLRRHAPDALGCGSARHAAPREHEPGPWRSRRRRTGRPGSSPDGLRRLPTGLHGWCR